MFQAQKHTYQSLKRKNTRQKKLFPSEVGRNFTPFLSFPLDDGIMVVVGLEPSFCPGNNLVELFCLRGAL